MEAGQFEQAVSEHQRMVFSIALHSLRDRGLAEEITQDVFLALLEHGDGIESAEHLVHWLRRVTTRRCIDQLRRHWWRRRVALHEGEGDGATAGGAPGDPLLWGRLQRIMQSLPATARLALVLRYQEDLEPAEIGRLLGVAESAVRKQLRRALTHLRARLERPRMADGGGGARPGKNERTKPGGSVVACMAGPAEPKPAHLERG